MRTEEAAKQVDRAGANRSKKTPELGVRLHVYSDSGYVA